ncbi:MAG: c-type cytochrome [Isosphaeraceae bacterium]
MRNPWFPVALGWLIVGVGVRFAQAQAPPKSLATWAENPFDVRLAFDREAEPTLPERLVGRAIRFEEPGTENDRQGALNVAAARLEDDGRTLVLTTDPHPRAGRYTLDVPGLKATYDLSGVEVSWREGEDDPAEWTGWWPSLDPVRSRRIVGNAPAFEKVWKALETPGRLTLTTLLTLPEGPQTIRVRSSRSVTPTIDGLEPDSGETETRPGEAAEFEVEPTGFPVLLVAIVPTGEGLPSFTLNVTTEPSDGSAKERPVEDSATLPPWVPPSPAPPPPLGSVPELSGGDPVRGATVFKSPESKCATCHKFRGQGGEVGPDLTDLVGRDRNEVYRAVVEPSAQIHPNYVSYTLALNDGRVFAGIVRAEGADSLRVIDAEGKATTLPRSEVQEFRPSATSIMPVGLAGAIGEQGLRDLIAYLTTPVAR